MDVVYEILETLHVFIPVVAIVVCIIIFMCGIRSSKSAQPPDEYLQEIKANSASKKTKNKTVSSKVSPKSSDQSSPASKSASPVVTAESKREKTPPQSKPVEIPAKKGKKSGKNQSVDAANEKVASGKSEPVVESTPWVVVTPKRKQKDGQPINNGSVPQSSPVHEYAPSSFPPLTKVEEAPKEVVVTKQVVAEEPKEKPVAAAEAPPSPAKKVVHESEDETWSTKDTRYRKNAKKKGNAKNEIFNDESPNIESLSSPDEESSAPFIPVANETRRRRNVRKEN